MYLPKFCFVFDRKSNTKKQVLILLSRDRKQYIRLDGDAFNHKIQARPLIYVVGKPFPQVTEAEPDRE